MASGGRATALCQCRLHGIEHGITLADRVRRAVAAFVVAFFEIVFPEVVVLCSSLSLALAWSMAGAGHNMLIVWISHKKLIDTKSSAHAFSVPPHMGSGVVAMR